MTKPVLVLQHIACEPPAGPAGPAGPTGPATCESHGSSGAQAITRS